MPKTKRIEPLDALERTMLTYYNVTDQLKQARADRDYFMRQARREGSTLDSISRASGLSVAQVQRICDLSKDRGTG